jgi:hypothetical protein
VTPNPTQVEFKTLSALLNSSQLGQRKELQVQNDKNKLGLFTTNAYSLQLHKTHKNGVNAIGAKTKSYTHQRVTWTSPLPYHLGMHHSFDDIPCSSLWDDIEMVNIP